MTNKVDVLDAVVVGAGWAGLGVSHALKQRGLSHQVLERGRIGETWRTQRWGSFRMNTPNVQTVMPGDSYEGTDLRAAAGAADMRRKAAVCGVHCDGLYWSEPGVAPRDFGMYITNGAPDEMKLGTAMSLSVLYKSCDSRGLMNGIGPYFSNTHAVRSGRKAADYGLAASPLQDGDSGSFAWKLEVWT